MLWLNFQKGGDQVKFRVLSEPDDHFRYVTVHLSIYVCMYGGGFRTYSNRHFVCMYIYPSMYGPFISNRHVVCMYIYPSMCVWGGFHLQNLNLPQAEKFSK